jgi:hypothetical protein
MSVSDSFPHITMSHQAEAESLQDDKPKKWWASGSANIQATSDQVEVKGPGRMYVKGAGAAATRYAGQWDFELRVEMVEAVSNLPVTISGKFFRVQEAIAGSRDHWDLVKNGKP